MTFEKFNFILLAGGKSTRFGNNSNKSLITFRNSHLIENTLRDLEKWGFSHITLVYNKKDKIFFDKFKNKALLVLGGKERSDSVKNALSEKSNNKKYTIIHDLARPIIHKNTILKIIKYLNKEYECVVPYSKVNDTVIQNQKTINRNNLKLIKTPQGFITKELKKVHKKNYDGVLTDDSELFRIEGKKYKIKYFEEKKYNFKLTYKEDKEKLKYYEFKDVKFGIGYDIHRLEKNKKKNLIKLGGVSFESYYRIISHSDGDVILHSITDSILGAISDRDIGVYFPNNKSNKNKNSSKFLLYALNKIKLKKLFIGNIDIMVISENPKINIYYNAIIRNLCKLLQIKQNQITIKATTNEKSGLIGDEKFIAVWSSILLKKI